MSSRETRLQDNGALQQLFRLIKARCVTQAPQTHGLQIKLIGLRIGRRSIVLDAQFKFEALRDESGDFVLQCEDVFHLASERVRPNMEAVGRFDQLRGDAHLLSGTTHTTLDDVGHA